MPLSVPKPGTSYPDPSLQGYWGEPQGCRDFPSVVAAGTRFFRLIQDEDSQPGMSTELTNAARPGLWRRLAAIFYDAWLIVGIWLIGVIIDTFLRDPQGLGLDYWHLPLQLFFFAVPFLFYGWFWTHGGQTLGMRAWRLRLLRSDGKAANWRSAIIRVAAAHLSWLALGLGYVWILFDSERLAWHDRLSSTRLVIVAKD